ncbi:hypothetical protein [Paramaledivibacter caminithermalis]|jgi:hypothetical protein|uniref:Uncharacterized protein n=1 Tax=Paramaledivibacter caminithermalis (strain DSM 15212 / CIP 107654 / DViRD3) TaxID=1121301 RepID=A0A1M6SJ54_PARC5|nr:hypothetical protein [Paramaledivibacter caminithermalis]SHK44639.1 hypothetical protein SAMN02745912_03328 [Paramaledivibacter caminithermalis DSM 15212]
MNNDKKKKDDSSNSTAIEAMNLIDKTYNSRNYNIIPKQENAYVMPWSMKNDVDMIDTSKFYKDMDLE